MDNNLLGITITASLFILIITDFPNILSVNDCSVRSPLNNIHTYSILPRTGYYFVICSSTLMLVSFLIPLLLMILYGTYLIWHFNNSKFFTLNLNSYLEFSRIYYG